MTPEQVQPLLRNLPPEEQQQVQQMLQIMTPEVLKQMLQDMPPAEQEEFQQQLQQARLWLQDRIQAQRVNWVRQTMVASGTTDAAVQDAVIAFMQAQEKARQPLRARVQAVAALLIKPGASAEELKQQLAEFRDIMKKDEARYKQELSDLDEKIKYSTQPRLETLLSVLGVVGPEAAALGGVGALFPDSPMARPAG